MSAVVQSIAHTPTLSSVAEELRKLQEELSELFPEREALVTQLIYGLLTREHVLCYGKFGTGKSRLVGHFFSAFTGGDLFSIELTKFMGESNVVGIPNPKILREEGRIWHERKGTALDAHFFELDEFFDANDYLLRVFLGLLNERRFNRGVQHEKANLHMALASTNANPDTQVKNSPTLGAVVDRFLFKTEVKYLTEDESRRRMYTKYLRQAKPSVSIPYEHVAKIADHVVTLEIDDLLVDMHNQIVQAFQKETKEVFSDRRACQSLKLAQANAILFGRDEVLPEDFLATRWAFCFGHDKDMHEKFITIASPIIEKVASDRKPNVVQTQMKLLDEFVKNIPDVKSGKMGNSYSPEELVTMRRTLLALQSNLAAEKPTHVTVEDRLKEISSSLDKAMVAVNKLIDGE